MSRQRVILIGLAFVAISAGVGIFWWWNTTRLPGRGTATYREYQRAFQIGTAALEAGRADLARKNLDRAIELIPGEPAAWANRGLLSMRNNNLEPAAKDLARAHSLAPDNAEIESLLAVLAHKQGRFTDAVKHRRKAVEQRPDDIVALFALAEMVNKEAGAKDDAEYLRVLDKILALQPNNLYILGKRVRAAHQANDDAILDDTLNRLATLGPGLTQGSQDRLRELRKLIAAKSKDVPQKLGFFANGLLAERGFPRDSRPAKKTEGMSLQGFVKLEPARTEISPADRELAFKTEPAPGLDKPGWRAVTPLWLIDEKMRPAVERAASSGGAAIRMADLYTAGLLAANADEVRRVDIDGPVLPFPSGPKKIAPGYAGVLAIDWDNDFRQDLVFAGAGGLKIWHQNIDGAFVDVTARTELPAEIVTGDYFGAWTADLEADGDLDIILARRSGAPVVLRNNGDGTFRVFETFANVKDVRAFVWVDLDNDGAPDAVFLDAAGKLHIFSNERSGQFAPWPLPNDAGTFLAIAGADLNDDGVFDLAAVRSDGAIVRISDQDRRHKWEIAELARWPVPAGASIENVSLFAEEMDNNGAIDLVVAGGNTTHVFLADEGGKFTAVGQPIPFAASAVLDRNNDGRLDLVGLSAEGRPVRAINMSKKGYRWQSFWPMANPKILENEKAGDSRINSFGIGAEIEVRSGALVQKQMIRGPVVQFGLGEEEFLDVARIVWPNGQPQWEFELPDDKGGIMQLPADRPIAAAQRLTGSCPFLFTYDGTGMRFVGDFMWGTPLGMYVNGQNAGDFPQTTEWLKIRGEHLVPRGGYYDIRVHANLWEADYFDQLALIVVDHPPHTEIHVDERFFLTPTPPRLHVTTPAKPVAKAWDHHGKDATAEVRAIDGVYLDRAGRGRFQGVTKDHWVEVDLGDDAPKDGPVLLIARGWLHPTNSSINFGLAQGNHDPPRPLSLEVPDGKGGWKVALPALGFPAGKDKTMLIRLDGIDGKGVARRFRLRTSMEIYWDFLGYATELDAKLARLQRPTPMSADLRYRGVLEMTQKNASSPEVPHYDKVIHGPQQWRDLTGYYTRFGDVRELLEKVDDRYVIMNAGDEIALKFPVPAAPAAGWKRDFIWECDGWTRDGDMNTRFGNSVLPLPAHGKNDERPPGRLEDDPVYRRFPHDWLNYHTRYVTADGFSRGLRR